MANLHALSSLISAFLMKMASSLAACSVASAIVYLVCLVCLVCLAPVPAGLCLPVCNDGVMMWLIGDSGFSMHVCIVQLHIRIFSPALAANPGFLSALSALSTLNLTTHLAM